VPRCTCLLQQNDRAEETFRAGAELSDPGATLGLGAVLAGRGEARAPMDVLRRAEGLGEGKATKMIRDLRKEYSDALD
jgi:hypothetical protein